MSFYVFFFNDTATTEIYTLSLHDALPIWGPARGQELHGRRHELRDGRGHGRGRRGRLRGHERRRGRGGLALHGRAPRRRDHSRSEEHTSELQSRQYLVCRLLLEKKTKTL